MGAHWHDVAIVAAGPSPWYRCSRPSCRLVYRTVAFVRATPPDCPACGQRFLAAHDSPEPTRAQREVVAA